MSRLTKIEGEFMGVKFEVKPTPLNIDEIEDNLHKMMVEWYEENEPDVLPEVKGESETDWQNMERKELRDKVDKLKAWKRDKEFRSKFLEYKATSCMDFKGKLPDGVWKSPEIELSTINEAWDFFCGNRTIPNDGLQAR